MKKYFYFAALFTIWTVFPQDLSVGYTANDLTEYPMRPLAKPDYLSAVTDPSFPSTTIRRISEADPGRSIVPMYSTIQAWNADESLLIVYAVGGGHRLLNGTDYSYIRDLSDISPDDLEAVFWHFTDPDILFYMDNNSDDLIRYNVNTQSKTVLANMRALSGCGSSSSISSGNDVQMMSWDSDVFAFRCGNSSAFYYRISTGVLTEFNITDINYTAPMPFPSGNLFYHNTAVYNANGDFVRDLNIEKGEHSCLGKLSNGDDAYFAISFAQGPDGGCLGTLVAHNATTGNCFAVTPTADYGYSKSGTHISALAHKNSEGGWVAVSSMGYERDGVKILDQELFLAKVDEFEGTVYRVAHHRSDEDDIDYWGEPHVTISPTGTRLLYGSDWSGTVDGISVDAYIAELGAYEPSSEEEECTSEQIIPEYRLDGVWSSGESELTVPYGTEVMFSMLPDNIDLTVEFPDGTVVGDEYNIGAVTPANNGPYLLTSSEGCTTIITLTVEAEVEEECTSEQIVPEYRLDGVWSSGENTLTVAYDTEVMFSMLPNNIGVTVEFPDGTVVGDDYNIGTVTPANNGPYLLTSSEGCTTVITLTVEEQEEEEEEEEEEEDCATGQIIPEYRLDGVWSSGQSALTVAYGTEVMFSMLPNNIGVTVEFPDGTVVGDDYYIGNVTPANNGAYLLTSLEGCTTIIDLTVEDAAVGCAPGQIVPEYRLDGEWSSGLNNLTVDEGTEVMFSMLPNNVGVTVAFPDGTVVGDDYNIGAVTPTDNGAYVLTSSDGCQTTINLTVVPTENNEATRVEDDLSPNSTISLVYPNPTKGLLQIDLKGFEEQQFVARVFNTSGHLVSEEIFTKDHAALEELNLNELPDGLYYLILESKLRKQAHSVLVGNR